MSKKRVTIYDIAAELGITASYVSRALNDYPSVNKDIVEMVKKKAAELNYKHNSFAANLRQGSSKTIGVIVPHISHSFFSETIAGIEEVCMENGHSLVICQSHESFKKESLAIETLIRQNVDCIFISISIETRSTTYLEEIIKNDIGLIQFDRYLDNMRGYCVTNDNSQASYNAVTELLNAGYKRIAFLGGPECISIFRDRKQGYHNAMRDNGLTIIPDFIVSDVLGKEPAFKASLALLSLPEPPDAFFVVSDHQSLGVLAAADHLNVSVPNQLGIIGFANEFFTTLTTPTLSSIDQHSRALGRHTANLYFNSFLRNRGDVGKGERLIIESELILRKSSKKENSLF
jgi:DNA-binding LacI/PurR family transcriptional regulator